MRTNTLTVHGDRNAAGYLVKYLKDRIAYFTGLAKQLQGTLDIISGGVAAEPEPVHSNGAGAIVTALQLDAERRAKTAPAKAPQASKAKSHSLGYGTRAAEQARRQKSIDFLATFDKVTPRAVKLKPGQSTLLQRGYLKRKDGGYVRTTKPFPLDPRQFPSRAPLYTPEPGLTEKEAKYQAGVAVLALFSPEEPRPIPQAHVGRARQLVRFGYLSGTPQGGYVRTAKELQP